jgi:hypothetical protein
MPSIKLITKTLKDYQSTTWTSEWIYLADVTSTTMTFLCDNNCSMTFNYSIDEQHQIIYQESYSLVAGSVMEFINTPVKTRYFQIDITGITLGSDLIIQGFYQI